MKHRPPCPGCKRPVRWWQAAVKDDIPLVSLRWHLGCFLLVVYHVAEDARLAAEAARGFLLR